MYQMLDLIIPALTYVDEMRDSRIRSSNLRVIKCAHDMLSITSLREYHLIRDKIPSNYRHMSKDKIINVMRNVLVDNKFV
ncbi:MAG: hypothetical protein LBQ08_01945 [Holosporaceae bacterium]|jgi:hypothetical protein|nr:hypothetical protein [Holosporaceae bacterium]